MIIRYKFQQFKPIQPYESQLITLIRKGLTPKECAVPQDSNGTERIALNFIGRLQANDSVISISQENTDLYIYYFNLILILLFIDYHL